MTCVGAVCDKRTLSLDGEEVLELELLVALLGFHSGLLGDVDRSRMDGGG